MNLLVAVIGIVVLLSIAVGVGMSLDTQAQRRAAHRLAEERWQLQQHRAETVTSRCPGCPWRHRG